jgi:hypothetical protein
MAMPYLTCNQVLSLIGLRWSLHRESLASILGMVSLSLDSGKGLEEKSRGFRPSLTGL